MSTRSLPGPIHAIPVDDDREKLRKENAKLQRENEDLRLENQRLEMESRRTIAAAAMLKKFTDPLYKSLRVLNGEFEAMDLPDPPATQTQSNSGGSASNGAHVSPRMAAALERLSGTNHSILKAIIELGPITQVGMSKAVNCAEGTASNVCVHLKKLGLIRQNAQKRWEIDE